MGTSDVAQVTRRSRRPEMGLLQVVGSGLALAVLVVPVVTMVATRALAHHLDVWVFIAIDIAVTALGVWRIGLILAARDQARRSAEERESYFHTILDNVGDLVVVLDPEGRATYVSPSSQRVIGYSPGELTGGLAIDAVHPGDRKLAEALMAQSLNSAGQTVVGELRLLAADGSPRLLSGSATTLEPLQGEVAVVIGMHDVTEQRRLEQELAHRAMHDELTGLPNRALIIDRCTQMLAHSRRAHSRVAALFIDLDDFKDVNDTFGHAAGDVLLVAVARRLNAAVRRSDTVGRLGGDEFVVLTEDDGSGSGPEVVAERVLRLLQEPFYVQDNEDLPLLMTASIGIAEGPAGSADELLRDADVALYRAKALGKRRYVVFEPEMFSAVKSRLQLEMDLREAIATEQFFLVYQPTVHLSTLEVTGVEALLRWRHPTRGVVTPSEFIPMMEESGSIIEIGRWILQEACMQAAAWQRRGLPLSMSVNLSARQLESDELVGFLKQALETSLLNPSCLILEVTETTLMRDPEKTAACLRQLHSLGVSIALDDFGTGYCSFGYLQAFPLDILKIDRSFVSGLSQSEDARTLVRTLVHLGSELGLVTLAEGIEEQEQLDELLKNGCQTGQGFLFAEPLEPAALEDLLRQRLGGTRPLELVSAG
jgi:diguanylate cyclase (GGDEF)-like protein/PAS domain S-box-containing protein